MKPPPRRPPSRLSKTLTSIRSSLKRSSHQQIAPPIGSAKWSWGGWGWLLGVSSAVATIVGFCFPKVLTKVVAWNITQQMLLLLFLLAFPYIRRSVGWLVAQGRKALWYDTIYDKMQKSQALLWIQQRQMEADLAFDLVKVQFSNGQIYVLLSKGTGAYVLSVGNQIPVLSTRDSEWMATLEVRQVKDTHYVALAVNIDPLWKGDIYRHINAGKREMEPPPESVALLFLNSEAPELNG